MSAAKAVSSPVTDRRNKIIAGTAFALVMVGIVYYELADPSTPAPAPAVVSAPVTSPAVKASTVPGNTAGPSAKTVGSTAAALDPTLHVQAMLVTESVAYTGTGRNIFAGPGEVSEMAAIPKPIGPVRTTVLPPAQPAYRGPSGPPQPPPIDLKFFGMATSADGHRQAFLLHGDDVFLATKGDIVQRKYRVIDIGPNSIQIEDMSTNNRQTLPLQATP